MEVREELIGLRGRIDASEHRWLVLLHEFDTAGGWALDGARSLVGWLVFFCGLSRVAASERARVAKALAHRPLIAAAMADGRLSYSKVRAMTRVDFGDRNDEVDALLVDFATAHTAPMVEALVRRWKLQADDDADPDGAARRFDIAALRACLTYDGKGVVELVTAAEEHVELLAVVDAEAERQWQEQRGKRDDALPAGNTVPQSRRRADALLALVRRGAAATDFPDDSSGADRYTVNLVTTLADLQGHGCTTPTLSNGQPVSIETALRMSCDCSIVRHVVGPNSEPLDLGRKTSVWNLAQRRAIRRRDGFECRFPGCTNRIADVHHIRHWTRDRGRTDVDNGCLLCSGHHTLVHEGRWEIEGNPNGSLTFVSPDGRRYDSPPPTPFPAMPRRAAA